MTLIRAIARPTAVERDDLAVEHKLPRARRGAKAAQLRVG